MSRRAKIEAMLQQDPGDVMLRYMLAMEFSSEGDLERAVAGFRELMNESPPHVPSFLMAAQRLVQLDEIEEARAALRDGIEQARAQGDSHAAAEMADLLASLGMLG